MQQAASVVSANKGALVLRSHIGSHYILPHRPQVSHWLGQSVLHGGCREYRKEYSRLNSD